jgi:hypothetical protein
MRDHDPMADPGWQIVKAVARMPSRQPGLCVRLGFIMITELGNGDSMVSQMPITTAESATARTRKWSSIALRLKGVPFLEVSDADR